MVCKKLNESFLFSFFFTKEYTLFISEPQKSPKPLRVSLKGIAKSSDPLKPKLVRLSQKIVKKAKSKKRLSPALRLSGKLLTSPKGLSKFKQDG